MLPVTALSSFVYCPKQFYATYVLKEKVVPNKAMVLGSVKHRAFDIFFSKEESVVSSLSSDSDVFSVFRDAFVSALRKSVVSNRASLRSVGVSLDDAFRLSLPAVLSEAKSRAGIVGSFLSEGVFGSELWNSLTPKVRSEFSIKSDALGLKGRVDYVEYYPDFLVPVELKSGSMPDSGVWDHHRVQAVAYALLFEDVFGASCSRAVVYYVDSGVRREVVLNPFLRDWVKDVVRQANDVIASGVVPEGCGRPSCVFCSRPDL